jgi:putative peptidoglycan lipid II flippase
VVSSLQYSLRLQELILGIFAVSIGTVLLPDLAEYAKLSRWDVYNDRLTAAMEIIAMITIPVTFFSLAEGETLIRLLFRTRNFDEKSVSLTLAAFTFHMPGLFFIALNRILAPAFYAQSDSRSPALAGIISFAVNMLLALILARSMRGAGIALALSLAGAANTGLLLLFLMKNPDIRVDRVLRSALLYALRLTVFSAAAVIPVLLLKSRLGGLLSGAGRIMAEGVPLIIEALVFAASGVTLLVLSRDRQFRALLGMLKRRQRG